MAANRNDSDGEEGKFYVWSEEEIDNILGTDNDIFKKYYNVEPGGNWEEKNILHRKISEVDFAKELGINQDELVGIIDSSKIKLLAERNKRIRPGLDDKILTSWNALAISGFVNSFQALGEKKYLEKALENAAFVKKNLLREDYQLFRNYKDGQVKINAFLDDYAFLSEAFINLYQVTLNESWLYDARKLTEYAIAHFYDAQSKLFNYTSDLDPPLIARKKELGDNVIPGSNSAMARNLHFLGQYFPETGYQEMSDTMLYSLIDPILQSGQTSYYSNWALLYLEKTLPTYEIAIVGDQAEKVLHTMQNTFLPNTIYLGGTSEGSLELLQDKLQPGSTMVYVCQNKVCQLPVTDPEDALKQIRYFD